MHAFMMAICLVAFQKPIDTVVICPKSFQPTMNQWVEYRAKQGYSIAMIEPAETAEKTRAKIIALSKRNKLEHVVICGDTDVIGTTKRSENTVPAFFVDAKVNIQFGSEEQIATDAPYADLNGDRIPELSVGRITADSKYELNRILTKIKNYEQKFDFSAWRKKINFVAGVGGFGTIEDSLLETATKQFITRGVPRAYDTSVTYASWHSPYCPDPRRFHTESLNRMNEGSLFWVYIGHGYIQQLDQVNVEGNQFHIFDIRDVPRVRSQAGLPIAVFLACYTAAFDAQYDCLAEELLRAPSGPIAILGGTRVTTPYAMGILSNEMLNQYFGGKVRTLGEVLKIAKINLASEKFGDQSTRKLLDSLAMVMSPTKKMLKEERYEHIDLFHLIGDPLLQIKRPVDIPLKSAERKKPGELLAVSGVAPMVGKLSIELTLPREKLSFRAPKRIKMNWTAEGLNEFQATYEKANRKLLTKVEFEVKKPGSFTVQIPIPMNAKGTCNVNAFIQSTDRFALGNTQVKVR